jgi:hypothetical protein
LRNFSAVGIPRRHRSGKARVPKYFGKNNSRGKRFAMQFECIAKMANLSQYCTSFVGTVRPIWGFIGGKRKEKERIQLQNYQG